MVGQNQSFKKYFVATNGTLITSGSTDTLAQGRLGLYDARTYAAVAAPTLTTTPELIIAQGTPDLSELPPGAFIRNETDKAEPIVGKKIYKWQGKPYKAGQNQIVVLGNTDDEDDTNTITGKCEETIHLYIKLTGKPIEDLFPGGTIKHYAVTGPCCDPCEDNCDNIEGSYFRDALFDMIEADVLIGGIKVTDYVAIEKIDNGNYFGISFESAFVERDTNACYFNIFPYNSDPVHIQLSTYNPDWHKDVCENEIAVTEIQAVQYPHGDGNWVIRKEAESKMRDYRYYDRNLAVRLAEGTVLNTDPNLNYHEYILGYEFEYLVGGWGGQKYTDRYEIHVLVPTGQQASFQTAMNTYIASLGLGLAAVTIP